MEITGKQVVNDDSKDTALLIIDMQQGFVREGNGRWCVAGAAATVPVIASLLADCRNSGRIAIFHIVREYEPDGTDLERCRLESFHRVPGAIRGRPVRKSSPNFSRIREKR